MGGGSCSCFESGIRRTAVLALTTWMRTRGVIETLGEFLYEFRSTILGLAADD
jgi:hypothetical protein